MFVVRSHGCSGASARFPFEVGRGSFRVVGDFLPRKCLEGGFRDLHGRIGVARMEVGDCLLCVFEVSFGFPCELVAVACPAYKVF